MPNRTGRVPAHAAAVASSPAQIAAEHRRLRSLLERIQAQTESRRDLESLLALLDELRAELEEHFAHEEAPGGMHDVIDAEAPHLLGRVADLFDEHRRCLEELDALRERGRAVLGGPVAEVLRGIDGLCRTLHEHEAAETEILSGALYDEIGGSG